MYAAPRNYHYVRVFADVKVVINKVCKPRSFKHDGDVHALALGVRLDNNIDARLILFGDDIYISGHVAPRKFAV